MTSEPPGISCPPSCAATARQGSVITLRAEPDPGAAFAGWTGPCAGRGWCAVTVRSAIEVGARFVVAGTDRPVPADVKRPSDLDRDGVVDDEDECPVEPGSPADKGCPP